MAETYQTKIYTEQGGKVQVYKSGATLNLESGVTISLAGGDIAPDDLRRILVSEFGGTVVIEPRANSQVLPTKNLPKNVRHVRIYGSTATISASFWLTSVSAGREVFIYLQGNSAGTFGNASTQIDVSCSGCTLLGAVGGAISGFEMHTSIASDCWVHLFAVADNVWAIVGQKGDIDE